MLKVAIVGCGHMGRTHASVLAEEERVRIVAVADPDETRAKALAHAHGARALGSLSAVMEMKPDVLYLCTPNTAHVEPACAALAAGVHVFSEKPTATDLEGARKVLAAARSSKALYQVGFNRRFAPVYRVARTFIAEKTFEPHSALIKMNRGELKNPPWVGDPAVTGGFLFESTIHLFDMARHLLGEVADVWALARKDVYDEFDDYVMMLRFESGVLATFLSCAHATWIFPFERIELYGEHTAIVTQEMESVEYAPGLGTEIVRRSAGQLDNAEKWGYRAEDKAFIDAVLGEGPLQVTAEDGVKAVELAVAVLRSVTAGGAPVRLPLA